MSNTITALSFKEKTLADAEEPEQGRSSQRQQEEKAAWSSSLPRARSAASGLGRAHLCDGRGGGQSFDTDPSWSPGIRAVPAVTGYK